MWRVTAATQKQATRQTEPATRSFSRLPWHAQPLCEHHTIHSSIYQFIHPCRSTSCQPSKPSFTAKCWPLTQLYPLLWNCLRWAWQARGSVSGRWHQDKTSLITPTELIGSIQFMGRAKMWDQYQRKQNETQTKRHKHKLLTGFLQSSILTFQTGFIICLYYMNVVCMSVSSLCTHCASL